MLHIAMFDAANTSESQYEEFYYKESAPHNMIAELVAAGTITNALYPSSKARFEKRSFQQIDELKICHAVARKVFENHLLKIN